MGLQLCDTITIIMSHSSQMPTECADQLKEELIHADHGAESMEETCTAEVRIRE